MLRYASIKRRCAMQHAPSMYHAAGRNNKVSRLATHKKKQSSRPSRITQPVKRNLPSSSSRNNRITCLAVPNLLALLALPSPGTATFLHLLRGTHLSSKTCPASPKESNASKPHPSCKKNRNLSSILTLNLLPSQARLQQQQHHHHYSSSQTQTTHPHYAPPAYTARTPDPGRE